MSVSLLSGATFLVFLSTLRALRRQSLLPWRRTYHILSSVLKLKVMIRSCLFSCLFVVAVTYEYVVSVDHGKKKMFLFWRRVLVNWKRVCIQLVAKVNFITCHLHVCLNSARVSHYSHVCLVTQFSCMT